MEPDDLYPNDSSNFDPFREPIDQVVARKKERAQTLESASILRDIIAQLEYDIAFYGSVDSIPAEVRVKPKQFLIVYNANLLTRDVLRIKKEWIESLIEASAKK